MQDDAQFIYSQPALDLVTVSTEYCKYLEQGDEQSPEEFCRILCGLLPMIYLKVSLLGDVPETAGWNEKKVTEADYDYVRARVAAVLGPHDDFLDVQVADFKYSDRPVLCTVSECLADVYQQLRELVEAYRGGYDEAMEVALAEAVEEFRLQWGQKLLGALRALHDLRYTAAQD